MWTLRTVRNTSATDTKYDTKRDMLRELSKLSTTYKRRIGQLMIVHIEAR